jgi:hypothetical protein
MRQHSPRDDQASESLMRRLDRAADGVNPFLIILMVGLLVLTVIRVAAMGLSNFPITRVDPSCLISPVSTTNGGEPVKRAS